jgi:CHAT domain-containing protein
LPITGNLAIEERFKFVSMSSKPEENNIFHIATHSFSRKPESFDGLSREEVAFKADGLLFSGAGHAINKERLPDGMNDGLLFSEEVARLDLRSADLVVLSACNTAKGEDTLDGILGIQRAFKRAGAGTIVMTLWKVSDQATMCFMDLFYGKLSGGASKYDAFKEAQATLSREYRDPYYWAPFIMLD